MSIARHHAEWLSLLEISGPFVSMPVLLHAFPQGLDAHDPDLARTLRLTYEEWLDNQQGLRPDVAIHRAWVEWVLRQVLEMPDEVLWAQSANREDSALSVTMAEYGERLVPDWAVIAPLAHPGRGAGGEGVHLLIQLYPPTQDLERPVPGSRWAASPGTRMMALLHGTGVRLGLVTNGERWMLVDAPKGETTGFVSWYAALWLEEPLTLRAFRSLLSARRFFGVAPGETIEALLADSAKDQQEVTDQLGYQVRRAVEVLVQAIDVADQDLARQALAGVSEGQLYEAALTVMMRLVFLLCAEERGLLLLGDPLYDQNYAVSTLRAQLRETADQYGEEVLERRFDAWYRLLATFRAVQGGIYHDRITLPAYGGSLFDPARFPFLEGSPLPPSPKRSAERGSAYAGRGQGEGLPITNRTVLHLLEALQMLQMKVPGGGAAEARRLSFRALDIEQIGYVYEGLLDHTAVRATEPVVGLAGTKDREPEIPLRVLEEMQAKGDAAWLAFLRDETGRSASVLAKAWQNAPDMAATGALWAACGNDEGLVRRVLPFAGLIRNDDYGRPVVVPAGSAYVTAGQTRRATGTHYTRRSLTEPMVQHTLEPLVYLGPAEGWPRERWRLRPAAELLELKICDMTVGTAAFLVQADRYLAERLVEAWDMAEAQTPGKALAAPEGRLATGAPHEQVLPRDRGERLILAQRIVAERCLYGVDKNPLAVEIAKLSLWLVTLAKGRPFTFLDHALKCGDSLVGADEKMFRAWAYSQKHSTMSLFSELLEEQVAQARRKRRELEGFAVQDVRDAALKQHLLAEAEAALAWVRQGCDLLVGVRFLGLKAAEQEAHLANWLVAYGSGVLPQDPLARRALAAAREVRAFHWPFEFPEVFEQGGVSAFVGNPPFMGGQRIYDSLGREYRNILYELYPGSSGNADYSAFFFLRAYRLLRRYGCLGLIATNTISQGDTRQTGLEPIVKEGGIIYDATVNQTWPGQAAVIISSVHIAKGPVLGKLLLNEKEVGHISVFLDDHETIDSPTRLAENLGKAFKGHNVQGMGFILSQVEATRLIEKSANNRFVLSPFLNGQDLNSRPDQSASRWVINFRDWPLNRERFFGWIEANEEQRKKWLRNNIVPEDYPAFTASDFPDCLDIIREKVKPERDMNKRDARRERWWQYGDYAKGLISASSGMVQVLARSSVSNLNLIAFVPVEVLCSHALVVFASDKDEVFALLQAAPHTEWLSYYASSMKTDIRYTPSDCFETYPFPNKYHHLNPIGREYYDCRKEIMHFRQEGLTKTYNRLHDPGEFSADFVRLRELHVEMDRAVAAAYGWDDMDLGHGFQETKQGVRLTISEAARREVLARLLALNHERHAAEVKVGLGRKGKKGNK